MRIGRILLAGALCLGSSYVQALMPNQMTEAERRALPPWCEFTQSFDRASHAPGHYQDYVARYGHGWTHVHHFCWALASIVRYNRFDLSPQERRHLASTAIDDMDYVLRNAPEDFILRFDIMQRKARLLVMTGELEEAQKISKEMQHKWPRRADSHGMVAEVLLALNRKDAAAEVLKAAEAHVDDAARLRQIRSALKL